MIRRMDPVGRAKTAISRLPYRAAHSSRLGAMIGLMLAEYRTDNPGVTLDEIRNALTDAATDAVDLFPVAAE